MRVMLRKEKDGHCLETKALRIELRPPVHHPRKYKQAIQRIVLTTGVKLGIHELGIVIERTGHDYKRVNIDLQNLKVLLVHP